MTRLATSPATAPHTLLKPPAPRPLRRTFHPAEDRFEILLPSVRQIREMRVDAKLREWRPVLARIGLGAEDARAIARRAVANDTGFARELLASGKVVEDRFFRAIAVEVGLGFIARISPKQIVMDADARLDALRRSFGARVMMVSDASGNIIHVMARSDIELGTLRKWVNEHPDLSNRLRLAPPSVVRKALVERTSRRLLFDAENAHALHSPHLTARTVITGRQGLVIGVLLALLGTCLALAPAVTILAIHVLAALTFFSCIMLRLLALRDARPIQRRHMQPGEPDELPVYSVIVALYREREIVPQLLVALGKLQWPRSKLEIKIVCEADDAETLAALRAHRLHPCIEIIEVPPGLPRTKPKALAYALPLCSGEFVTLYDAEDRPDPYQLAAAYARFRRDGQRLACLQAPLVIGNTKASILATMFAFEYAGLFRGLLPFLARSGLPLPLGGTSNHFRRSVLTEVGGWDAFNVTEDADLGLRLARYGYQVGIIRNPTMEDAPERLREWLPQRIRWFKGWMQTWLVHMRHPVLLWRELGFAGFLAVQIVVFGMILSALVHPVFLASVLYVSASVIASGSIDTFEAQIVLLALAALVCGYGAFIMLGWRSLAASERPPLWKTICLTPVHWVLLSVAGWVAIWELWWRPHHWHKTPHRRSVSYPATQAPERRASRAAAIIPPPRVAALPAE